MDSSEDVKFAIDIIINDFPDINGTFADGTDAMPLSFVVTLKKSPRLTVAILLYYALP